MKWFENIKIRSKLFFVFGVLVCIMVAFASFVAFEIVYTGDRTERVVNTYQARQICLADASVDFYSIRFSDLSRGYLLEGENFAGMVSRILEDYDTHAESFVQNMENYREMVVSDSGFAEKEKRQRLVIVDMIESLFADYMDAAGQLKEAVGHMDKQKLLAIYEKTIPIENNLGDQLQELRTIVYYTSQAKIGEITKGTARALNITLAFVAGFVALSVFALFFSVGSINRPISRLEKAVAEIAGGNLAFPVRSERKDELGLLANNIGDMVDKLSEREMIKKQEQLLEAQNAELSLQASKIQTIFDSIPDMVFVKDTNSCFLQCNHAMETIFGCRCEDIIGKNEIEALGFDPEVAGKIFEYEQSIFREGRQVVIEENITTSTGTHIFETIKAPLRQNGDVIGLVGVVREITERKEMEAKILTASKAKSDFLAKMSHEIRTPMNAIMGITEILAQNNIFAPDVAEALDKIYNSGDLLLGIINDILDLSKIEAGKFELVVTKYNIASLINDTATLNMMRIGSKPIEFVLSVDENIPLLLLGDELRIKQILNNLLSNAFKYTAKGRVELSVYAEAGSGGDEGEESEVTIVFTVSDTGQGMTKKQVGELFDEYSRFNMQANRTIEGAGLGMNITQNLINIMRGQIFVDSEVGLGSVFTVHLPQKRGSEEVLGRELAQNLQNFRAMGTKQIRRARVALEPMPYGSVLVVDDVESNRYVAKGLMSPYKLSVDTAASGFDAIEKIKGGKVYDIVFMDHMMPVMDGVETVRQMRENGYSRPIVALTANAVIGQSEMFLENGFDDFISKPIDVRQLDGVLKKFVQGRHPPEVVKAAKIAQAAAPSAPEPDAKVELAGIFARDAAKTIATLEEIHKKIDHCPEEDLKSFTIIVHGMKSSLAYMGEPEMSALAYELEQAGRSGDLGLISSETPAFLAKLRALAEKHAPPKQAEGESGELTPDDQALLREKLPVIKEACESFDKKAIKGALSELKQKSWPPPANELLDSISECLLGGDYAEIANIVEKALAGGLKG